MRRRISMAAGALWAFVIMASISPLRAAVEQSTVVDGIKITVAIAGDSVSHFGFIPVRVIVDNRQPRELLWEARFSAETHGTGSVQLGAWSTNFVVPPGRTSERWLIVPSIEAGLLNRPGFYGMWGNLSATFSGTGIRST